MKDKVSSVLAGSALAGAMTDPTFGEFVATREHVEDLRIADCYGSDTAQSGYLYDGRSAWAEDFGEHGARTPDGRYLGRYGTVIGREEFYSDSLADVERFLYLGICTLAGWEPRGVYRPLFAAPLYHARGVDFHIYRVSQSGPDELIAVYHRTVGGWERAR